MEHTEENNIEDITVIDEAISKGRPVKLVMHIMSEKTQKQLNYVLKEILNKYSKEETLHVLYTIIKEMISNGTKANLKRIIFRDFNLNLENMIDYKKGLEFLRERLREQYVPENVQKLKEAGIKVEVLLQYNKDYLTARVKNDCALSTEEDRRIREKFAESARFNDIAEFYMAQLDENEGAGIGIGMILLLLKQEGITHHNFVIKSDNKNYTLSSLNYPFSPELADKRISDQGFRGGPAPE